MWSLRRLHYLVPRRSSNLPIFVEDLSKALFSSLAKNSGNKCKLAGNYSYQRIQHATVPAIKVPDIDKMNEADKVLPNNQLKNRMTRMKALEEAAAGYFSVLAFATAEEYDLERLIIALREQNLYIVKRFFSSQSAESEPDVLHVTAKYQVDNEIRELYFFREGTVVLWNCNDLEASNILSFLKSYEKNSYDKGIVFGEREQMHYNYHSEKDHSSNAKLKNNRFYLSKESEQYDSQKYTFSNSLSASVKLGIWEASLSKYVDSMEFVTDDLKKGNKIKISRAEMLRKTGELFALRHLINLSSDLLDTPDYYWDREDLETLYSQTCSYFSLQKRTKVMNEKLNHCVELADLINSHLNDIHHVRLEWMIIILIMVEVGFETLHYVDRFIGG